MLVLAALAVAACGGPAAGPALSDGEFLGQAGLICLELERQALVAEEGLLGLTDGDDVRLADARRVVAGFALVLADARTALGELRPPDNRRDAADSYLDALDRARSRLVAAGASEDATRGFLAEGGGVLTDVDDDEAALGLEACAGGPTVDAEQDSETMGSLRTALQIEQLVLAGDGVFSESIDDLRLLQPGGRFEVGLVPVRPATVNVKVADDGTLYLSARSRSGVCFYVLAEGGDVVRYAIDPGCGPADTQQYAQEW